MVDLLFRNLGAYVNEDVRRSLQDFVVCERALPNPRLASGFLDELLNFRIGECFASGFFVAIPAAAGLLAKAAHLTETVSNERIALALGRQLRVLFADPPADVQPGQVADGQRAHRHAEISQSAVDLLDAGPFL